MMHHFNGWEFALRKGRMINSSSVTRATSEFRRRCWDLRMAGSVLVLDAHLGPRAELSHSSGEARKHYRKAAVYVATL